MRNLTRVAATVIVAGMLMLACVGLNPLLVGMAAFAALALVAKSRWANAARDGPQHRKSMFYHGCFGVQIQRSDFAMAPMSRSCGGMGRTCHGYVSNTWRVHDGIARRLAGLTAKVKTMYRMYNARDSNGRRRAVRFSLHQRETLAMGYH